MSGSCGNGIRRPSTRIVGAIPVVMWRSDAPFSYITLRSSCIVTMVETPCRTGLGPSIRRGHPQHFFERRDPLLQLRETRLAERLHPEADRLPLQIERRAAPQHEILDLLLDRHHFVKGDPPAEPGPAALFASLPCISCRPGGPGAARRRGSATTTRGTARSPCSEAG